MSKRLLFITSRLLWPVDGGRKMSLNYYCKGLHEQFGYDVYLYCFLEKGQHYDGTHPDYIKEVYVANEISVAEKLKNLITKTITPTKWPVQCSLYFSKANFNEIKAVCKKIKPQVVFSEMIRTSTYFEAFNDENVKTIANLDDLLSKRYLRQARTGNSKANIAGAYAGKLPDFINRIIANQKLKNFFLKYEAKRCAKWEYRFYDMYDYSMFTSPIETNEINETMGGTKGLTLSVGVDYELFSKEMEGTEKEPGSMSYVGNFKVAANIDTLKMICEDILPLIKYDYKFYVIGLCPEEIQRKYSSDKVIFTGRVENLDENVKKTQLFLSPILYGTGIKTKIVEAMAMGMPVITNSVGAEGIDACAGKEFIVEDEYVKIARAVDGLLGDETRMKQMGEEAQKFAFEHFRWEIVYQSFVAAGL